MASLSIIKFFYIKKSADSQRIFLRYDSVPTAKPGSRFIKAKPAKNEILDKLFFHFLDPYLCLIHFKHTIFKSLL